MTTRIQVQEEADDTQIDIGIFTSFFSGRALWRNATETKTSLHADVSLPLVSQNDPGGLRKS